MIIGYARVSTYDQQLDLQTDALRTAGAEKMFTDTRSGAKADRPGLAAALDFARGGDTLVVWRLDRLGRSLKDLLSIVEGMQKRGVGLRSLHESIDTTTANGRLLFHFFGAMAEFERALLQERVRAGLDAARARGRKGGRKPKLDEKKKQAARAMLADRDAKVDDVAAVLGVSRSTLYRAGLLGKG